MATPAEIETLRKAANTAFEAYAQAAAKLNAALAEESETPEPAPAQASEPAAPAAPEAAPADTSAGK